MIRIGNMLIDPNDISSIHREMKVPSDPRQRGFVVIQIVYKNGVVKNLQLQETGVQSYEEFIDLFMQEKAKIEDSSVLRLMAAVKSMNNG